MTPTRRILIVHPDEPARALLDSMLKGLDYRIDEVVSMDEALQKVADSPIDLVIADSDVRGVGEPVGSSSFLTAIRRGWPRLPIVLLNAEPRYDRTRDALTRGANSVLRYPMPATQLRSAVAQALDQSPHASSGVKELPAAPRSVPEPLPLNRVSDSLASSLDGRDRRGHEPPHFLPMEPPAGLPVTIHVDEILGANAHLHKTVELADALAPTMAPILVVGERGTGKRRLAHRIHRRGSRPDGPFVELTCGGRAARGSETELLGDLSLDGKPSCVAKAAGGTLYLDDISQLSPSDQSRLSQLLREVQDRGVTGCRLIVGSRSPLAPLVHAGRFLHELANALAGVVLSLPPLRLRRDDIPQLAATFAARSAAEADGPPPNFSPMATQALLDHDWPGNLHELKMVIERAILMSQGEQIEPKHLMLGRIVEPPVTRPKSANGTGPASIQPLKKALEGPEKQLIHEALEATEWNRQLTAKLLDINRTTLYKKMKKYDLLCDEPVWAN